MLTVTLELDALGTMRLGQRPVLVLALSSAEQAPCCPADLGLERWAGILTAGEGAS